MRLGGGKRPNKRASGAGPSATGVPTARPADVCRPAHKWNVYTTCRRPPAAWPGWLAPFLTNKTGRQSPPDVSTHAGAQPTHDERSHRPHVRPKPPTDRPTHRRSENCKCLGQGRSGEVGARLDAPPLHTKASSHHEGDNEPWHGGQKGPSYQGDEHSGSITRG